MYLQCMLTVPHAPKIRSPSAAFKTSTFSLFTIRCCVVHRMQYFISYHGTGTKLRALTETYANTYRQQVRCRPALLCGDTNGDKTHKPYGIISIARENKSGKDGGGNVLISCEYG